MKTLYLTWLLIAIASLNFAQDPSLEIDKVLIEGNDMGQPWGMAFISADELVFTEKSGKLFKYKISTNTKTEITGLPSIAVVGQGGLLDVAVHPDFASNKYVYLSYSISGNGGYTLAIGRGVLKNNQLTSFTQLFTALPFKSGTNHFGSRITFDNDKHLIFSSSERQESENAQMLSNHLGKVIRLNDEGSTPNDNPFVNTPDAKPEIYSYGHRNIQGLVVHPTSGKIYAHEHGPKGGDELNLIEASKNYGWPSITFGIDYDGSVISEDTARDGMEQPIRYWVPSIAPCGMAIVHLENQEENEVNFIVGALSGKQIQWIKTVDDKHIETYSFLQNYARFRDVEVSPDGQLYALTESPNKLVLLKTNQLVTAVHETTPSAAVGILYPNPASDFVQIEVILDDENAQVSVFTNQGETVATDYTMNDTGIKMDISTLKTGIYIVKVTTHNNVTSYRLNKK